MKNFVQQGAAITVVMPYAANAGAGVQVGAALFGVAAETYGSGDTGVIATEGVFDIAKVGAQAWTAGDRVYWDNTAKNLTKTATSNLQVGVAIQDAGASDATGRVKLTAALAAGA